MKSWNTYINIISSWCTYSYEKYKTPLFFARVNVFPVSTCYYPSTQGTIISPLNIKTTQAFTKHGYAWSPFNINLLYIKKIEHIPILFKCFFGKSVEVEEEKKERKNIQYSLYEFNYFWFSGLLLFKKEKDLVTFPLKWICISSSIWL